MPEPRRSPGTGVQGAGAPEDAKTPQCSPEEWVSRVPDGGWGWLVVGGSFVITVSVPLGGYSPTGQAVPAASVQVLSWP